MIRNTIRSFLIGGVSRRQFVVSLSAAGLAPFAARRVAQTVEASTAAGPEQGVQLQNVTGGRVTASYNL